METLEQKSIEEYLIGKTLVNLFNTNPIKGEDIIDMPTSYFSIVFEIETGEKFKLGYNQIMAWNKEEELFIYEISRYERENNIQYINQKIKEFIHKNKRENPCGSLCVLLENNTMLEFTCHIGDGLFIGKYPEDYYSDEE